MLSFLGVFLALPNNIWLIIQGNSDLICESVLLKANYKGPRADKLSEEEACRSSHFDPEGDAHFTRVHIAKLVFRRLLHVVGHLWQNIKRGVVSQSINIEIDKLSCDFHVSKLESARESRGLQKLCSYTVLL